MKNQPLVVSVAVHYNSPEDCINLLRSLVKVNYTNHRIVVVDNCSETAAYTKVAQFVAGLDQAYSCEIIKNKSNVGFGGGINYGFAYAYEKYNIAYLHVINVDAEVINANYLQDLVTVLEGNKGIGIIGPAVLKEDRKELQNTILPFVSLRTALNFRKAFSNLSYVEDEPTIKDVACVNGVCFLMPAGVFHSVDGFDTSYFMYGEEQDLCYKIYLKGLQRVFWSGLSIMHLGAEKPFSQAIDWRYVFVRKNQVRFLRKHDTILNAFILASLFSIKTTLHFIKSKGDAYTKLSNIIASYFSSLRVN